MRQSEEWVGDRFNRRKLLKVGLAALAAAGFSGLAYEPEAIGEAASTGGAIKVGIIGFPVGWDSLFAARMALLLTQTVLDPLVFISEDMRSTRPGLARAWHTPDGGTTWVFQLVRTAWHDGMPFTSKDVKAHYDRMFDPATGSSGRAVFDAVQSIDTPDPQTVRFRLKVPDTEFPILTGSYQGYVQAAHLDPKTFKTAPMVGTGPFKWDSVVPGQSIRLARNPHYFMSGQPRLDSLSFVVFEDQQARLNALFAGAIDVAHDITKDLVPVVRQHSDTVLATSIPSVHQTVYLRGDRAPGNNPKVVQALKLSVDRQALLQAAHRGFGTVNGDNPIPPTLAGWVDVGIPKRDVPQARSLLRDAGYESGIDLTMTVPSDAPDLLALAQGIQSMAAEAGFRIKFASVPMNILFSRDWLHVDFSETNWSPRPNVDSQFRVAYTCDAVWNESHWCDPKFDTTLNAARAKADLKQRRTLQAEAQRYIADHGTVLIPYHFPIVSAVRKRVEGYKEHAMLTHTDFRNVSVGS